MKVTIDTQAKTVEVHEGTLGELVDFLGKGFKVISRKEIPIKLDEECPNPFKYIPPATPWYPNNPPSPYWYVDPFKMTC